MRLDSDFHDYYNHSIGFEIDEKLHYNLFQKERNVIIKSSADGPRHRRSGLLYF